MGCRLPSAALPRMELFFRPYLALPPPPVQQVLYHSPLLLHHHLQLAPGTLFIEAAFVWLRLLPHTGTQAVLYIPLTFKVTVVIVQEFPC